MEELVVVKQKVERLLSDRDTLMSRQDDLQRQQDGTANRLSELETLVRQGIADTAETRRIIDEHTKLEDQRWAAVNENQAESRRARQEMKKRMDVMIVMILAILISFALGKGGHQAIIGAALAQVGMRPDLLAWVPDGMMQAGAAVVIAGAVIFGPGILRKRLGIEPAGAGKTSGVAS